MTTNSNKMKRELIIKKMKSGEKTTIKDLAILCSNCHRAVHRLKVDDPLKELQGKFER